MDAFVALLSDYTFSVVALGSMILGMMSGILGCFAVLKKQSLLGDGVSHAALPGVVFMFLITGHKNTQLLLLGALLAGLLATLLINLVVTYTRIKFDSALAVFMSVFFGLGIVLLTYVQKIPNSNQAGLKTFIYGQASTLLQGDVYFMSVSSILILALVLLFWKEFKVLIFDQEFGFSIGLPVKWLNLLLSFLIVSAIIIGLQTVGVILMSAMLISPAVAARQWTNKLSVMVLLSAIFGASSGLIGTMASSLIPRLPTGPAIVVCISILVLFSLLFSPQRGILLALYRQHQNRQHHKQEGEDTHVTST